MHLQSVSPGPRIHLFGASGSGATTLGRALAQALNVPHLDTDDYYWALTEPPYQVKREPAERLRRIEADVAGADGWVLSGSLCSWGDPLLHRFTLAVFLYLDPHERLTRLEARERRRYGQRVLPGGDMHGQSREFLSWACRYDAGEPPLRSLALHESWMQRLACPVVRVDSAAPVEVLVEQVVRHVGVRAKVR